MATVILDVPSEKVSSFMSMIVKLGLNKHSISSGLSGKKHAVKKSNVNTTHYSNNWNTTVSNWDFNKNQLEFE